MPEFTDMAYHWMNSLPRFLKSQLTLDVYIFLPLVLYAGVTLSFLKKKKIQSGSKRQRCYPVRGVNDLKEIKHTVCVLMCVHPCVCVHTSLDNDHDPSLCKHNTFTTKSTQKLLLLICPICKLLCSR